MKKKEALREYCVELKENCLPIQYDVALFCDCLKSIIPTELPEYLASFEKAIMVYASQIKVTRPKQFPRVFGCTLWTAD